MKRTLWFGLGVGLIGSLALLAIVGAANAQGDKPFTMNAHVRERIRTLYPEIIVKLTEKRS